MYLFWGLATFVVSAILGALVGREMIDRAAEVILSALDPLRKRILAAPIAILGLFVAIILVFLQHGLPAVFLVGGFFATVVAILGGFPLWIIGPAITANIGFWIAYQIYRSQS